MVVWDKFVDAEGEFFDDNLVVITLRFKGDSQVDCRNILRSMESALVMELTEYRPVIVEEEYKPGGER